MAKTKYDIEVSDTIAWNITMIVVYTFLAGLLSFIVGMMIYWIIFDGYMVFMEGLFMFLFVISIVALVWNIVLKFKDIWRIRDEIKRGIR